MLAIALTACSEGYDIDPDAEAAIIDLEGKVMEHEEAIGECMRAQGFEYLARLPPDWIIERAAMEDRARGGDGVVDVEPPPDPNQEVYNQLSRAEQIAYENAYWGDVDYGGTNPGCYLGTFAETWELDPLEDTSEIDAEIHERISAHPEIIEAEATYAGCMAQQGRELSSYEDVYALANLGFEEDWLEKDAIEWQQEVYADHETCQPAYDEVYARIQQDIVSEYYP